MIEIRQSEIEDLIHDRLTAGGFESIEQVLLQALRDAPLPATATPLTFNTADMLADFQRRPYKEVDLDTEGVICPISDPVEF